MATAVARAPDVQVQLLHAVVTLDYDAVERLASVGPLEPNVLGLEAIAYDDSEMLELLFDLKLETPNYYLLLAAAWHGANTLLTMLKYFQTPTPFNPSDLPPGLPTFGTYRRTISSTTEPFTPWRNNGFGSIRSHCDLK